MEETLPYMDLPPESECTHRNWYVRSAAYQTLIKYFKTLTPSSREWDRYKNVMGKIAAESSPPIREQALEVVLLFVKRCDKAGETSYSVINSLLYKLPVSSKSRAKELLVQIILQYVEIGSSEDVIDRLLKTASDNHSGNVPTACLRIITKILSEFGPKPFDIKYIVDSLPHLQDRNDQEFRSALKSLIVELYRWLGPKTVSNIRQILSPAEINEVRREFDSKNSTRQLKPSRLVVKVDKMELTPAMEIDLLSRLDQSFFERVNSSDWTSRRDALLELVKILANCPKLQPANFESLLNSVKKIIMEDQCVIVVGLAIRCITGIAKCLQQDFSPYAVSMSRILLEKFVEKRQHITDQLREALDVVTATTTFESLIKTINGFLDNRNPTVRFETIHLLFGLFRKSTRQTLRRPEYIVLYKSLARCLHHSQLIIREKSLIALGVALAIAGEGVIMPHLVNVDSYTKSRIKNYKNHSDFVEGKYNEIRYRNVANREIKRNEEHVNTSHETPSSVLMTSTTESNLEKNMTVETLVHETLSNSTDVLRNEIKRDAENFENINKNSLSDLSNAKKNQLSKAKSSCSHTSTEFQAMSSAVDKRLSDSALFTKNKKKISTATFPQINIHKSTVFKPKKECGTRFNILKDDLIISDNVRKNAPKAVIVMEKLQLPQTVINFAGFSDLKCRTKENITAVDLLKTSLPNKYNYTAKSSLSAEKCGHKDENTVKLTRKVTSDCNIMKDTIQHSNLSLPMDKGKGRLFLLPENELKQLLKLKGNHGNALFNSIDNVLNLQSHRNLLNRSGRSLHLGKEFTERETQTIVEYNDKAIKLTPLLRMTPQTERISIKRSNVISTQTPSITVQERGTNPYRTRRFSRGTQGVQRIQLEMQTQTPFVRTAERATGPIKGNWTTVAWSSREMANNWKDLSNRALSKCHSHMEKDNPVNLKSFLLKQVEYTEPSRKKEHRKSSELRNYVSTGTDPCVRAIHGTKKTVEINTITVTRSSEPYDERPESRKPKHTTPVSDKPESRKTREYENANVDARSHETTILNSKASIKRNVIRGNTTVHSMSHYNLGDSMDENERKRNSKREKTLPTFSRSSGSVNVKEEHVFNRSEKKIRFDSKEKIIRLKRIEHRRSKSESTRKKQIEEPIINRVKSDESQIPLIKCPMPHNKCRLSTMKNYPNLRQPYVNDSSIESFRFGCNFLPLIDKRVVDQGANWRNESNLEEDKLRKASRPCAFKPHNSKRREKFHISGQGRRISSHPKYVEKKGIQKCNSVGDRADKRCRKKLPKIDISRVDASNLDPQTKQTILKEIMTVYNISQTTFDDLVRRQAARPCLFTPNAILQRVNGQSSNMVGQKTPSPERKRERIVKILKPCVIL